MLNLARVEADTVSGLHLELAHDTSSRIITQSQVASNYMLE
jgi:hypothetical protein